MMGISRRIAAAAAVVAALLLGPLALTTALSPGVALADCAPGQFWNAATNNCDWPPPPPPPAGPVSMCIGAPVPFVPMSWCFPVGGQ
ncbi:MAG: hypothetical protein JO152_05710 [Mycobacteriaceae bacterium]|nr:hypothetical protein [Mycobacteriaceae bacterium]